MALDAATLSKIKLSMRITTDVFDSEISDLADAALADLKLGGANGTNVELTDPLVLRAVTTYCKLNFGAPDEYDRLKRSYDEQKAQLGTASGYTTWSAEA